LNAVVIQNRPVVFINLDASDSYRNADRIGLLPIGKRYNKAAQQQFNGIIPKENTWTKLSFLLE
jgi:hypothetical protein